MNWLKQDFWPLRLVLRAYLAGAVAFTVVMALVILAAPALPQGPQIAFMSNRAFNWDIYLLDLRTGTVSQLTDTPNANERYPAWSPDGTRIAYHANFSPEPAFSDYNIHIMQSDGTGITALRMAQDALFFDEAMADWSPDGERLVFHSGRDNFFNLFVSDLGGFDFRAITGGDAAYYHASWSPDGERLAFVLSFNQNTMIYTLDVNEGYLDVEANLFNMELLVSDGFFPAWSPDGERIAYVSNSDGDEEIYVIGLATGAIQQLTRNVGISDTQPEWTADGESIVFSSNEDGRYHLYMMAADGVGRRQLTRAPFTDDMAPDWRP